MLLLVRLHVKDLSLSSSMHLKPLRRQFEAMEECEYLELEKRLPAVYHLICLIWSHSKHYQQPSRLVVLMQEISNLMIELVKNNYYRFSYIGSAFEENL